MQGPFCEKNQQDDTPFPRIEIIEAFICWWLNRLPLNEFWATFQLIVAWYSYVTNLIILSIVSL